MLNNLRDMLGTKNITIKSFAEFLNVSEKTAQNKLNGITSFTYPEAKKVKTFLFPEYDMEYLFKDFGDKPKAS